MTNIWLPAIFNRALSVFEDPTGLARPEWQDWSRYQGFVNHQIALDSGVQGMFARATISWGYQDQLFGHNYIGAGDVGMYRSSYHVIYPGQPVIRQMDNWYGVHPTIDIIPRVLDLELKHDQSPNRIADVTWQMSEIVLSRDGMRPLIYSRHLLINDWLRSWTAQMLNDHYYILAQYKWDRTREHPGPPTLPYRIKRDRIVMHQTADKKPAPIGMVQSKSVDRDRWEIGNVAQMHQWIREHWGGGATTPPPPRNDWYANVDSAVRTGLSIELGPLPPPAHVHTGGAEA